MKALYPLFFVLFIFCSCSSNTTDQSQQNSTPPEEPKSAYSDLNVEQFKAKMKDQNVVILDVRTPQETAEGIIEGAIEIDIKNDSFAQQVAALDKDKTYLIYCRSGGRSSDACSQLADQGFKDLYNLTGGYTAWEKEGE